MEEDSTRGIGSDLDDLEDLAITLVMADAVTPRGRPGPLARQWAAGGFRKKDRAVRRAVVGSEDEDGRGG